MPPHAGEQGHLPEHVAAAEFDSTIGKGDFDRARGDEVDRVAPVALAHDPLVRHREAGPQKLFNPLQLLVGEIGEQVQFCDQPARIEPEIETRPGFRRLRVGDAVLEIVIDLGRDQPFIVQVVVASHLAPHRRLPQEPGFERRSIFRILPA